MPILLMSDDFNKYAANVTVSGFTIVFIMLILLILIISLFGIIMSNTAGKKKAKETEEPKPSPKAQAAKPAVQSVAAADDDETIAVIAAAVEAFYADSGKRAVVRSIKPSETFGRSAWSAAGIAQNTKAF